MCWVSFNFKQIGKTKKIAIIDQFDLHLQMIAGEAVGGEKIGKKSFEDILQEWTCIIMAITVEAYSAQWIWRYYVLDLLPLIFLILRNF